MNCPECGVQARCYETRPAVTLPRDIPNRRRRYECRKCGIRFGTREFVQTDTRRVCVLSLSEQALLESLEDLIYDAVARREHG